MTISNPVRTTLALALVLGTVAAAAQKYTPEPPPLTTAPCKPTKKDPCPTPSITPPSLADQFPFPGEKAAETPSSTKPQTSAAPNQSSQGNPFPGEPPESATPQNAFPFPGEPAGELPTPASSSSSSSSSSDNAANADQPALKDEGSTGSTRFARKKLQKVVVVDPDERESRDLEVSRYYFTTGNFEASYSRAKDAVTTLPDDPAAHLALAEAARHLNKPDEARTEYQACLKLDATDPQAKAAHKGLAELTSAEAKEPRK